MLILREYHRMIETVYGNLISCTHHRGGEEQYEIQL